MEKEEYLTYSEYRALGGQLEDQVPFKLLEFRARKEIDKQTLGRLIGLEKQRHEVKLCMFELITLEWSINNGVQINANVINYNQDEIQKAKNQIIENCLGNCMFEDGTLYISRMI